MRNLGTQTIETRRLILRKFTSEDAENMYRNWTGDDEVTKYLTWPAHKNVEDSKEILKIWIDEYEDAEKYQWCIELKENREAIGSMSVVNIKRNVDAVEIGYCIGREYWNWGITSEALSAVIKFFFEEVGVNRVEARHDPNNENSGRVMIKCGLKYEGRQIKADRNNTGICDVSLYGMTLGDYDSLLIRQ